MARGDSGKKVSRAARAGGKVRSAQQRSLLFPGFIVGVVVLGVLLIVLSLGENEASTEPPTLGEHWHAAYGIFVCDQFMPPLSDRPEATVHNLHTHEDGLVHIHPNSSAATGTDAKLSLFADTVGMELGDDSIDLPGDELDVSEGDDDCNGEDAEVRLAVWEPTASNQLGQATAWDDDPTIITEDIDAYRPQDNELLTIAFVPPGTEIPQPPSIAALAAPVDETGQLPPTTGDQTTDTTTGDETTDTTAGDETTETTATETTATDDTGGSG